MSESEKIKQLESKVELLSKLVLEIDYFQRGLYALALRNSWSIDKLNEITSVMFEFNYKKESYTYKDVDARLVKIVDNIHIPDIIKHFYHFNMNIRTIAMYLYTFLNEKPQTLSIPFEYEKMYVELMNRDKIHPAANPFYVTPLPYCDENRYAKKGRNQPF